MIRKSPAYRSSNNSTAAGALLALLVVITCWASYSSAEAEPVGMQEAGDQATVDLRNNPFKLPAVIEASRKQAKPSIKLIGGLELRAILFSKTNPLANLNGKILSVGEEIQGYRLANVYKTHVELVKNSKTYELKLNEEPA